MANYFLHINKTGISGGSTCQKLASSCSLGHASLLSEMTHHYWKLYIGNPDKTSMVARCQNMKLGGANKFAIYCHSLCGFSDFLKKIQISDTIQQTYCILRPTH